jgi:hypothetical protein
MISGRLGIGSGIFAVLVAGRCSRADDVMNFVMAAGVTPTGI